MCCCAVATRLAAKDAVYCYGQRLPITRSASFTAASPSSDRRQHLSESSEDQPGRRGSQTETSVEVAALDAAEDDGDDSGDEFVFDLDATTCGNDIATTTRSPRCRSLDSETSVADWRRHSDTVEPTCSDSPSLTRCQTCPGDSAEELTETDDVCKFLYDDKDDDDDDDDSFTICERAIAEQGKTTSIYLQSGRSEPAHEQLPQNAEVTRKLQFSAEKMCLVEKMIAAGSIDVPCKMRVVMAENAVELVGADENVKKSEIKLYELIVNFNSIAVHLCGGVVKLLLTSRGQRWLQTQLASLDAVFYAKDCSEAPLVIGANFKTSTDAKFLLESALSSRKISFDDQQKTFLQSVRWAEAVEKFESEFFVAVNTNYREKEIVIEGSVEALNDISGSVEVMLRENSRVQRKIIMKAEQFQLLKHFRVEIHDKLKSITSQHQQDRYSQSLPDILFLVCAVNRRREACVFGSAVRPAIRALP